MAGGWCAPVAPITARAAVKAAGNAAHPALALGARARVLPHQTETDRSHHVRAPRGARAVPLPVAVPGISRASARLARSAKVAP
jgi:hypothetical protein